MNNNLALLREYKDKVFVYNVLCVRTYEYYNNIKSFINIPLILSSSVMTILNSGSFTPDDMKIPNIVVSGCTALMIALINNYKVAEKAQVFRNLSMKYQTLQHDIEHKLCNDATIDGEDLREITKQYDDLLSQNEFTFPEHIKKKVKNMFVSKKYLPLILCDSNQVTPPASKEPSNAVDNYAL